MSQAELINEMERIFREGRKNLLSLHHQKMDLINHFQAAKDIQEVNNILEKLKKHNKLIRYEESRIE